MFEDAQEFIEEPALSVTTQPELRSLYDDIADAKHNVTFVVGAGVSINSGLPSWNGLMKQLVKAIKPEYQSMAANDQDPVTRRAEYLLRMIIDGKAADEETVVRDALYPQLVQPGALALALATLTERLGKRARLITTNYDPLIEDALRGRGMTATSSTIHQKGDRLRDFTRWRASANSSNHDPGDVLHVHGLLEPGSAPDSAIVLTESHFLRDGPAIKELLAERVKNDVVVFLGVSLTDANLVGPLFETRGDHTYFIAVPHEEEEEEGLPDSSTQIEFFLDKVRSVTTSLHVKAIVLKSHSQEVQLLREMERAVANPAAYEAGGRYGQRYLSALDRCYDAVGADRGSDFVPFPRSKELSDMLAGFLDRGHALGDLIDKQLERDRNSKKPNIRDPEENLALFLWLRTRHGGRTKPYTLYMVGTSTYVARSEWSLPGPEWVTSRSHYAAVQAVFYASTAISNVRHPRDESTWHGNIAVPVLVDDGDDYFTVGALTLSTTRHVWGSDDASGVEDDRPVSFFRRLKPRQRSEFLKEMQTIARQVIAPTTP